VVGKPGPVTSALPRTISLFGELDIRSAREMQSALSEAVGDRTRELVVDLRKVSFIDSTALGALVRAAEQLRNQGRMLTLIRTPGDPVDGLLEVSGLGERFELLSDPPEAAAGPMPGPAAAA
jgi:anti-sigma B factor antagonist